MDNKVIRTTVLVTKSYVESDSKFVIQQQDGTKKTSWSTLVNILTSTLPIPTTPAGTTGPTTPPPSTPPPSTPISTIPPTTVTSYGSINMDHLAGSVTIGSPTGPTIYGDTGSFGSGLVEIFVANELTGGGYSQIFSGSKSGSYSFPVNYIPSIPGNYTFQGRITVSGHTTLIFSSVGGWIVT